MTTGDRIRFRPMAFGGHCYYVRRCVRGSAHNDDEHDRRVGGIALPDTVAEESSLWVEVLGVGPRCGTPVSKEHCLKYKRTQRLGIWPIPKAGDLVKLPNQYDKPPGDVGLMRSFWDKDEFFVEESKPELIMEA